MSSLKHTTRSRPHNAHRAGAHLVDEQVLTAVVWRNEPAQRSHFISFELMLAPSAAKEACHHLPLLAGTHPNPLVELNLRARRTFSPPLSSEVGRRKAANAE